MNGMISVTVCPRSRDRLEELDQQIRAIITKGTVDTLTSQYSSDFKGIVVWFVEAEQEEIDLLKSKVNGVSITIQMRAKLHDIAAFSNLGADLNKRSTSDPMM